MQVRIGIDPFKLFRDVDWAILIGAKPRGPGISKKKKKKKLYSVEPTDRCLLKYFYNIACHYLILGPSSILYHVRIEIMSLLIFYKKQ